MMRLVKLIVLVLLGTYCAQQVFAKDNKLNIFACEPEWAALAMEIGGEHVSVYSATTYQQDPHRVQARPSLIAKARKADLLICTGAELEVGWLPLLIKKSANKKIQKGKPGHFMASDYVALLDKKEKVSRNMGDVHTAGNPHIHLNPNNMLPISKALTEKLIQIDAKNQSSYTINLNDFENRLNMAMQKWNKLKTSLKGKKLVVHHNSWVYFNQWLKLDQLATLEPKPGVPPSSRHLSIIKQQMKINKANLIIFSSYQSDKAAKWLSKHTTISMLKVPFSVQHWTKKNALIEWYDDLFNLMLVNLR